ncbi:BTAD domain-containing putative transcriptional regulator, partial [Nonomuraea wenchangensis]
MVDQPNFGVLGPLLVRGAGQALRVAGRKPRLLLASLLLEANQIVGSDALIEVLWPARAPSSAVANLRTYVSALRGPVAAAGGRIVTHPSGYAVELAAGQLDMLLFEELVERARAAGRAGEAAGHLRDALALWRGTPLSDLPGSPLWDGRLRALVQARLAAAEELAEAKLAREEYAAAVDDLRALIGEHPYREDLWQRLIVALHRGGRRAEALHAYTEIRRQLVDDLGIEPGPDLRDAHAAVLADEEPGRLGYRPPVPHQLPADVPDFTGRAADVTTLTRLLSEPASVPPAGPPVVAVVTGPPGIGKTALAVHCAHAVRDAYPEGQLHLSLGGTAETPAAPADLLAEALRALGVAEGALPASAHERATLYRSLLAGRPVLVLLDDAADAAQVRPLLPGSGCAVLVTSRRRITELPGAVLVELDALTPAEGGELLARIAGPGRVAAEPEAARTIVAACAGLPLALRVAGARLAARPGWSLQELRRRLDDESTRLDELRAGDLEVRASVELSYRRLPGEAALTLRALGLLGPGTVPGWVAGAVLDRHRSDAVVDALVDVSLLRLVGTDPLGQPRYRLPDLVRCTARERADGDAERQALARVLGGWTSAAEHAAARLPTTLFSVAAGAAPRWRPADELLGRLTADPLTWFDAEREALVEAVRLAASHGPAQAAWGLAATLVPYFDLHCRLEEWRLTHQVALDSAAAAGDRRGE